MGIMLKKERWKKFFPTQERTAQVARDHGLQLEGH
jgi:hypothetical protein